MPKLFLRTLSMVDLLIPVSSLSLRMEWRQSASRLACRRALLASVFTLDGLPLLALSFTDVSPPRKQGVKLQLVLCSWNLDSKHPQAVCGTDLEFCPIHTKIWSPHAAPLSWVSLAWLEQKSAVPGPTGSSLKAIWNKACHLQLSTTLWSSHWPDYCVLWDRQGMIALVNMHKCVCRWTFGSPFTTVSSHKKIGWKNCTAVPIWYHLIDIPRTTGFVIAELHTSWYAMRRNVCYQIQHTRTKPLAPTEAERKEKCKREQANRPNIDTSIFSWRVRSRSVQKGKIQSSATNMNFSCSNTKLKTLRGETGVFRTTWRTCPHKALQRGAGPRLPGHFWLPQVCQESFKTSEANRFFSWQATIRFERGCNDVLNHLINWFVKGTSLTTPPICVRNDPVERAIGLRSQFVCHEKLHSAHIDNCLNLEICPFGQFVGHCTSTYNLDALMLQVFWIMPNC